jgi:hypothetical protein
MNGVAKRLEKARHEPTEVPIVVDDKDAGPLLCPRYG